jgi:hypothetical protein
MTKKITYKCESCKAPWTEHLSIIATCRLYLTTVEALERVTRERDEARRWVCQQGLLISPEMAKKVAIRRGWDCYKETP